jgi:inward rectifier potassium channel
LAEKKVVHLKQDPRAAMPRIEVHGRKLAPYEDFYHFVLGLTWPRFFGFVTIVFAVINALFAAVYTSADGCIQNASGFWDHFFFSIQTLGTIGYGGMTPQTRFGHVVVSFEALFGILTTAVITGLTFARFARPTARILFSAKAVIAKRDGVPHLMFRLANWRRNQIVEATIHVMLLVIERTKEGDVIRRPLPIPLLRNTNQMFALTWTVMHTIDEKSPFFGEGAIERLAAEGAEIFVSVAGLDETIAQTVHARYRYPMSEIVAGARFADVLTTRDDGTRVLDFDMFHDIVMEEKP